MSSITSILFRGGRGSTLAMIDDEQVTIREIPIDATVSESHQIRVAVTEHPIETGATVTDHIRRLPDSVSLEGLFSDTVISLFDASQRALEEEIHTTRALNFFEEMANKRRLMNLSNRFKSYRNMVCTGVTFQRGSGQGDSVRFSAQFQQVQFARAEVLTGVAAAEVKEGINSQTRDQGKLAASTPSPETEAQVGSWLARIFGIGG